METIDILYQIRYYYHTKTDNTRLSYDSLIVYPTYEAVEQHLMSDWEMVRDDCDILEYTLINRLILKT